MHETDADLDWLDSLLARSYAAAGTHLLSIHTEAARVPGADLVPLLEGMQVLVVATVTADGKPRTGPLDGFFYRGRWHFGTSPSAARARHLATNPEVSATHVRGEELVVTVHGRAEPLDFAGADAPFAEVLRGQYGADWDEWGADGSYYAIEPDRMFAADMSVHLAGGGEG